MNMIRHKAKRKNIYQFIPASVGGLTSDNSGDRIFKVSKSRLALFFYLYSLCVVKLIKGKYHPETVRVVIKNQRVANSP